MMYLALTYDHRILDGREAVTFLVKVCTALLNYGRVIAHSVTDQGVHRRPAPHALGLDGSMETCRVVDWSL